MKIYIVKTCFISFQLFNAITKMSKRKFISSEKAVETVLDFVENGGELDEEDGEDDLDNLYGDGDDDIDLSVENGENGKLYLLYIIS